MRTKREHLVNGETYGQKFPVGLFLPAGTPGTPDCVKHTGGLAKASAEPLQQRSIGGQPNRVIVTARSRNKAAA
jgi:hypothetical protein